MSRKTPLSATTRAMFVEMADAAAYSKRQYKLHPDAPTEEFSRTRWIVLENTIENCLYVALHWPRDDARKYAGALVLAREHVQAVYRAALDYNPLVPTPKQIQDQEP